MDLHAKLDELGLSLPGVPGAVAEYVPAVLDGGLVEVSGQLPMRDGKLLATGPMPGACSLAKAQAAAGQCVLNGLAAADAVLGGDWSRLRRVVRLVVFVAGEPGFTDQHLVANGASQLLGRVFGEAGRHARAAVGVPSLPLGATVEVAMTLGVE